ncbi:MAG: hypothetical protein GF418_07205 [Chitinivibrionales bacterium]|nr:hypothetical protein [Chitinivibrionales bacterium]MBD3395399.1 hypothetical protein [Chitinivibrionales bacterium]
MSTAGRSGPYRGGGTRSLTNVYFSPYSQGKPPRTHYAARVAPAVHARSVREQPMKNSPRILGPAMILFFSIACFAWVGDDFKIQVTAGREKHSAGDTVALAVTCRIPENYHLYGNPLGPGIGKPLRLKVTGGQSIRWLEARKIPAKRFQPDIGAWVWAYETQARFFLVGILTPAARKDIHGTVTIDALLCHTACIPVTKEASFAVPVGRGRDAYPFANDIELREQFARAQEMPFEQAAPGELSGGTAKADLGLDLRALTGRAPQWDYEPVERGDAESGEARAQHTATGILAAILIAFLAGIILNVMPCVLPVLGVKILSFSQGAQHGRREAVLRSLVFAAGMITVFLALATLAVTAGYSWGQQFQNPLFLSGIIAFIFIFALGMFDVYIILVPSNIAAMERGTKHTLTGEFARGVFATILATPCSGPLLGATLAWTLTQPAMVVYAVFAAIGLGMASPYVVLSASRRLARIIPKPGRWMDDLKHVMGFLLLAFAVYLMRGLTKEMIMGTAGLCVALTIGVMLYKRVAPFGSTPRRRIAAGGLSLLVAVTGGYLSFASFAPKQEPDLWRPFTPALLEDAHMTGRHAVVNFTASWCMNCQYNKLRVLNSKDIRRLADEKDIMLLEVDLTNKNPEGDALMRHLGSRSIPFLAIFPGDDPYRPIIMRDLLSKSQLAYVLSRLAEKEG